MKKMNTHKAANMIAGIIWVVSFFTDKYFFKYNYLDTYSNSECFEIPIMWVAKIVYGALLLLMWNGIFYTVKKILEKDEKVIKAVQFFAIYFVICITLFLCVYPGIWRLDDISMLSIVQEGKVWHWHHWLTSFYFMICLMAVPIPAGVVFVTCILISLVVARVVYHTWILLKKESLHI